jgi:hypothetical protein
LAGAVCPDKVDVVFLERFAGAGKMPIDRMEELAFEDVEFCDGNTADAGVEAVGAENVAEALAGDGDGGDDEAVAGEGGEREERHAGADLVDVVEGDEEAGFLCVDGGIKKGG